MEVDSNWLKANIVKKISVEKRVIPSFNIAWHFHPEFEIVYNIKSNGIRFVGDNVSPFYSKDLVLVGSNLPHLWRSDFSYNSSNCHEAVKTIVIKFTEDFLGKDFFKKLEFQIIARLLEDSKYGLSFNKQVSKKLHTLLLKLPNQSLAEQHIGLLAILYQLSVESVCNRAVLSSSDMRQSISESPDRIDLVLRYISDNYATKITLKDVADVACITTNSFCRFFKTATNKSFTQFLNEVRIRNASRILIQQTIPVSEVCFLVGFNSITNFNKQFKHIIGTTPKEFRDSMLNS